MEIIKWVVTPPCRCCGAPPEFMHRYPCIGCEKLHRKEMPPVTRARPMLAKAEMRLRNARIAKLREEGLSYSCIAKMLKIPRATVQSAAAVSKRKKSA